MTWTWHINVDIKFIIGVGLMAHDINCRFYFNAPMLVQIISISLYSTNVLFSFSYGYCTYVRRNHLLSIFIYFMKCNVLYDNKLWYAKYDTATFLWSYGKWQHTPFSFSPTHSLINHYKWQKHMWPSFYFEYLMCVQTIGICIALVREVLSLTSNFSTHKHCPYP